MHLSSTIRSTRKKKPQFNLQCFNIKLINNKTFLRLGFDAAASAWDLVNSENFDGW